jgi:nicotinamide-nucleotide amidase
VVSYASEVKREVLGVGPGPVVSEDAACAMALGACRVLGADVAVAATGVAGPDPQEGQQPGTVWLATAVAGDVESTMVRLPGDRNQIRQFSVISVLNLLRLRLQR